MTTVQPGKEGREDSSSDRSQHPIITYLGDISDQDEPEHFDGQLFHTAEPCLHATGYHGYHDYHGYSAELPTFDSSHAS